VLFVPPYKVASKIGRKKPQAGPKETAPAGDIAADRDAPASGVSVRSRVI
jgi:hypothetical protein